MKTATLPKKSQWRLWFARPMLVIDQPCIPFSHYYAMSLCAMCFIRSDKSYDDTLSRYSETLKHEAVHAKQFIFVTLATLLVLIVLAACNVLSWWWLLASSLMYYIAYCLCYVYLRVFKGMSHDKAYHAIPMELQAYYHDGAHICHKWWCKWIHKMFDYSSKPKPEPEPEPEPKPEPKPEPEPEPMSGIGHDVIDDPTTTEDDDKSFTVR